jgi:hypothetical protein
VSMAVIFALETVPLTFPKCLWTDYEKSNIICKRRLMYFTYDTNVSG